MLTGFSDYSLVEAYGTIVFCVMVLCYTCYELYGCYVCCRGTGINHLPASCDPWVSGYGIVMTLARFLDKHTHNDQTHRSL